MKWTCYGCQRERNLDNPLHCSPRGEYMGYDIYVCSCGCVIRVSRFVKECSEALDDYAKEKGWCDWRI